MNSPSRQWSLLDQAATVHRWHCESLGSPAESDDATAFDAPPADEAVLGYGLAARRIYDALKRIIGQTGGLLILAQTSGRRDPVDFPSLVSAEEAFEEACGQLAGLSAPSRMAPHRRRLEQAAQLTATSLKALRELRIGEGTPDLAPALDALSRAYKILQSASESRFGMMMVDFRHACCTCGALAR
jgi:hypothetical protein